MGNLNARLAYCQVSEYQNIQIQGAGSVADAGGSVTAKLLFDAEQAFEQAMRIKACLECDDSVEKMRLAGEAHRLGGIEGRPGCDAAERFEARGCGSQRGLGWPRPAGQVRAHSDVGGLHDSRLSL